MEMSMGWASRRTRQETAKSGSRKLLKMRLVKWVKNVSSLPFCLLQRSADFCVSWRHLGDKKRLISVQVKDN